MQDKSSGIVDAVAVWFPAHSSKDFSLKKVAPVVFKFSLNTSLKYTKILDSYHKLRHKHLEKQRCLILHYCSVRRSKQRLGLGKK
jgi:hypothetical protein